MSYITECPWCSQPVEVKEDDELTTSTVVG